VAGSASAATSGTPRPGRPVSACPGTPAADWYAGSGNVRLTPPPVAPRPLPLPPQTVSLVGSTDSVVPPQPSTPGLAAGKSTRARRSVSTRGSFSTRSSCRSGRTGPRQRDSRPIAAPAMQIPATAAAASTPKSSQ
jgi:hypothetical protein